MTDGAVAPRLVLLRVKRKRQEAPQETIIVEEHVPKSKRPAAHGTVPSVAAVSGAGAEQFAEGRTPSAEGVLPAQPPPRRRRFRRVDTVPVTQTQGQSEVLLQRLLAGASRAAITPSTNKPNAAPPPTGRGVVSGTTSRAVHSAVARYTQVRHRRGLAPPSNAAAVNGESGPLQSMCRVYDVEALPMTADDSGLDMDTADDAAKKAARAARTQEAAQAKAAAAQEQRLMCNYVPMLQEVLRAQGVEVDAAALLGGRDGGAAGEDDEYVFDVYTVDVEDHDTMQLEEGNGMDMTSAWASQGEGDREAPVLSLYDPDDDDAWDGDADTRLAWSLPGGALDTLATLRGALPDTDSDPDGAEVDYPDEGDDDDDDEEEGDGFGDEDDDVWATGGQTRHVWQPRGRGATAADDEEYDTVAYEESEREEERFKRWAALTGARDRKKDDN